MAEDEEDVYMQERSAGLPDLDPPKHEKEKRTRKKLVEKDKAEILKSAYETVLASVLGRIVLYDTLDAMGYWNVPYDPSSPHITAYLAGNHAGAVELYEKLWAISPDNVLLMIKENRT